MNNIFNQVSIQTYYFKSFYPHISDDLYSYLLNNLDDENINTFRWDLKTVLTTNVNEEYI